MADNATPDNSRASDPPRLAEESPRLYFPWANRCFVCGEQAKDKSGYDTNISLDSECQPRYQTHPFFFKTSDPASSFVSYLPEVPGLTDFTGVTDKNHPLRKGFKDILLATGADGPGEATLTDLRSDLANPDSTPFPSVGDPRLTVGQPVLRNATTLAAFSGLKDAQVLDLSPYIWSGTHKDLKSWAVLSIAISQTISHLGVWTAGNAGISLAKLIHRWNATQPEHKHKRVYCLFDANAPEDLGQVIVTLQALNCKVAPISTGTGAVLLREQIKNVVESMVKAEEGTLENYWHVTDGWDGVGVLVYTLLALQCLLRLQKEEFLPAGRGRTYVIVPVGTGSLLFGFYKAVTAFVEQTKLHVKVVAALPYGDNMLEPFLSPEVSAMPRQGPRMERKSPRADKLTGFYSPLSPCLWKLTQYRDFDDPRAVEFIQVDLAEQVEAGARLFSEYRGHPIAAEPSALVAFGALKELGRRIKNNGRIPKDCAAIVVNTGFGVMGKEEEAFYAKSIFALR